MAQDPIEDGGTDCIEKRSKFQGISGISPQFIWPKIWYSTRTSILVSWRSPIDAVYPKMGEKFLSDAEKCCPDINVLRMSCCRIYVYAVFSSLGFKVFRA